MEHHHRKLSDVPMPAHRPVDASGSEPLAEVGLGPNEEPDLVASARTVVGSAVEEAGFLARDDGALFVVVHRPTDHQACGLLTVCSSLFAEQHTDYRREVHLARALASAGIAVARFHYRGVGNSAPGSASLEAFSRDALDVALAVRRATSTSRIAYLGVGVGSLVAARALLEDADSMLALWKPVLDGSQFFRDFFRARLIAAARVGGARPSPTDQLLAQLAGEGRVDVMGFSLAAGLYDSLNATRLAETLPQRPRRILVQPFRGSRATGLDPLVEQWRAQGAEVDLQPVKLAEDPWFIPDGAAVAATMQATEEQLIETTRDWLLHSWRQER